MKKFIILIASAFSFCLFTTLLVFAFVTNDYGIDVDESGLFPSFDFTFFDNESDQTFDKGSWFDISKETTSIKIKNNTHANINLYSNIDYSPNQNGTFSLGISTSGSVGITKEGATFNVNSIPYKEYDYTYINYDLYKNTENNQVNIYGSENINYNNDSKNSTIEHTIKAGETYEIKLP